MWVICPAGVYRQKDVIITISYRFPNSDQTEEKEGKDLFGADRNNRQSPSGNGRVMSSSVVGDSGASAAATRFVQDSAVNRGHPQKVSVSQNNKRTSPQSGPVKRYIPQVIRGGASSQLDNSPPLVPLASLAARRNGSTASLHSPELPTVIKEKSGVQVPEVSSSNLRG